MGPGVMTRLFGASARATKKLSIADELILLRIYSLLNADLATQTQCQKLWRKDPF